jgi:hypothetical protein
MKNIVGQRFHKLTVIQHTGTHPVTRRALWNCLCDCGKEVVVPGSMLINGNTRSCGCLQSDKARDRALRTNGKHGKAARGKRASEYDAWRSMKQRCFNPNCRLYDQSGGRGITVCERWKDSFANFLKDMGNKPYPNLFLNRIDKDGIYEPSNCRWATPKEKRY